MDTRMIVELIGYLGSGLVLLSFLMTSVFKLRIINAAGGVICTIYSLIIQAYPTALMNACLVIINLYYLLKIRKTERVYSLVEGGPEEKMIHYLLNLYIEDIKKYFPGFEWSGKKESMYDVGYIVCHDAEPAGILLGKRKTDGELEVVLDYSIPAYRDCSVGKYLYDRLKEQGMRKLIYSRPAGLHKSYLKKMEFKECDGIYVKELAGIA